jgi:hypothetical protein
MNVHPSEEINPPWPATAEVFAPEALCELKIDTDGNAISDIAFRVRSSSDDGAQTATLRRLAGAPATGMGDGGQIIVEGTPVSAGREAGVTDAGGYRLFAVRRGDEAVFLVDLRCHFFNTQ